MEAASVLLRRFSRAWTAFHYIRSSFFVLATFRSMSSSDMCPAFSCLTYCCFCFFFFLPTDASMPQRSYQGPQLFLFRSDSRLSLVLGSNVFSGMLWSLTTMQLYVDSSSEASVSLKFNVASSSS